MSKKITGRLTGKKLRELRLEKGMTIDEFAEKLGFSWIHMQRLETGYKDVNKSKRLKMALKMKHWYKGDTNE